MRNCDFYTYREAEKMHRKYKEVLAEHADHHPSDNYIRNVPTLAEWLYKDADTALQFDRGQVLQMTQNDRQGKLAFCYVVVKKFLTGSYCSAPGDNKFLTFSKARFVNADKSEFTVGTLDHHILPVSSTLFDIGKEYQFKMPDIPQELMEIFAPKCGIDLALEPLKAKCPFRDEYKEPVPPCMKGEE